MASTTRLFELAKLSADDQAAKWETWVTGANDGNSGGDGNSGSETRDNSKAKKPRKASESQLLEALQLAKQSDLADKQKEWVIATIRFALGKIKILRVGDYVLFDPKASSVESDD